MSIADEKRSLCFQNVDTACCESVRSAFHWRISNRIKCYTLRGHKRHVLIEKGAGGIKACSRWLSSASDDTTGRRHDQQFLHPGRGASRIFFSHPNPEGAAALNHRLHTSDASCILLNAKCVICDHPDFTRLGRCSTSNFAKSLSVLFSISSGLISGIRFAICSLSSQIRSVDRKVVLLRSGNGSDYKISI